MKRPIFALLGLLMLAGCHHGGPAAPAARQLGALQAAESGETPVDLTPDQALEKATKKAREWQPDARLVGVFWGVAKFQTTSLVEHMFHSPKAGRLFMVESKLTTFFQKTREIKARTFTWPARLMGTLETYPVSAKDALEIAKKHLPENQQRPVAALVLVKPNRFMPPLWLVRADQEKLMIHAKSGKVIVHTDKDIPLLPFDAESDEPAGRTSGANPSF